MKKADLERENEWLREHADWLNDQRLSLLDRLVEKNLRIAEVKSRLSEREIELMELVSKGQTKEETLAKMHISKSTYRGHLHNIYKKLEIDGDRTSKKIKAVLMFVGEWNEGICSL